MLIFPSCRNILAARVLITFVRTAVRAQRTTSANSLAGGTARSVSKQIKNKAVTPGFSPGLQQSQSGVQRRVFLGLFCTVKQKENDELISLTDVIASMCLCLCTLCMLGGALRAAQSQSPLAFCI